MQERVINASRIYGNQMNYVEAILNFSILGQPFDSNQNIRIASTYDGVETSFQLMTGLYYYR